MIVDTSVVVAILFDEPERERFLAVLASSDRTAMSAGSWIELAVVLSRRGRTDLIEAAERLREILEVRIVSVDMAQAEAARAAYLTFGRGTNHPAKLNFGDCFSYALAKTAGEPLLFKGDDFAATDVGRVR